MSRKTFCTLSTENLLRNLAVIRLEAPKSKVMAMVKANAYGHGIRSVSQRLEGAVDALGVASIDEAMALRKINVKTPITLIEGVFSPEEICLAAEQDFSVVFHSEHQLRWLDQTKLSSKLTAWVKINSGMGRLGFSPERGREAIDFLSKNASIAQPVGLISHLSCADEPNHPMNVKQISAFRSVAQNHQGPKSFCNSAGIFSFPDMHYDWVRPGLALYGVSPFNRRTASSLGLKPVMTFKTEIIAVQQFKRGESIGYGAAYTCAEDMPIGIVAVGYGDGYPRVVGKDLPVLVNGRRCALAGRISMDMAAVDLRGCPSAHVGDCVTLWGEGLPIEEIEPIAGRFSYDLLTSVQNRVRFEWKDEKASITNEITTKKVLPISIKSR